MKKIAREEGEKIDIKWSPVSDKIQFTDEELNAKAVEIYNAQLVHNGSEPVKPSKDIIREAINKCKGDAITSLIAKRMKSVENRDRYFTLAQESIKKKSVVHPKAAKKLQGKYNFVYKNTFGEYPPSGDNDGQTFDRSNGRLSEVRKRKRTQKK